MTLPSATVTVLTYNGERYLGAILDAVERQRYDGPVDVLVIDSGSTDATLDIVAAHPAVRLHAIPNEQFGHGRTRQLAAELADGEIVVYLTHDAVPASDSWLSAIVAPFLDDERVGAVLGKQVARPSAPPVLKYDIRRVFARQGPEGRVSVVRDIRGMDAVERAAAAFYSDANSAARRSVLLGPVPYRDVDYAEDQVFGRDILDHGLAKAYAPDAAVEHSNDTTLRTFGSRIAADVVGLRSAGFAVARVSWGRSVGQTVKWSLKDAAWILTDRDYTAAQKLYWLLVNPWYHLVKWRAYRKAANAPR